MALCVTALEEAFGSMRKSACPLFATAISNIIPVNSGNDELSAKEGCIVLNEVTICLDWSFDKRSATLPERDRTRPMFDLTLR